MSSAAPGPPQAQIVPADGNPASVRSIIFAALAELGEEQCLAELQQFAGLAESADELAELRQTYDVECAAARERAVAGVLIDAPRLGRLVRSGLAMLSSRCESAPDWAALSLALRRLPAWVLESADERAARLAAENEALCIAASRSTASRQPGARARSTAGSHSRGGGELFAAGQTPDPPARDSGQDSYPAWFATASPGEIRDYLRQDGVWFDPIRKFTAQDQAMLSAITTPKQRKQQALLTEEALDIIKSAWIDLARGRGPHQHVEIIDTATGQPITRVDAQRQLERIEREGMLA